MCSGALVNWLDTLLLLVLSMVLEEGSSNYSRQSGASADLHLNSEGTDLLSAPHAITHTPGTTRM